MTIGTPWIGTAVQGSVAGFNVTTVTVDVSGAPTGEVVFIFGTLGDAQTAALIAPSGWTILDQQSEGTSGGSSSRSIIYWKVKAAGDASVVIPTWSVTTKPQFVPVCWPGVDTTTPTEGLTWLAHTSGTSYVTGTATPTAANRWGVGFYSSRGSTASVAWSNSTQTQRVGVINSSSIFVGLSVADTNGAVTQASHSYTATGQTASHGLGAVLYLIPASDNSPRVSGLASANSNSAGYPVSVPGGTVDGDLLIAVATSDFGTSAGNAFGTGWTALSTSSYDAGTNAFHNLLWWRQASSEPASYTVSHDNSDSVAGIIRITNWDSASGASAIIQVAPNSADGGKTAPSISNGGSGYLLLTFHGGENSAGGARTWTPPSGMLEQIDRQSTTWTSLEVCSLLSPSNPTGTKAATPSAAVDIGGACALLIKAPGSGSSGSASLSATATISAAGTVATGTGSSLASTAALSAAGSVVFSGGSTQTTTAGLTATGTTGIATGATSAITAGLSVAGAATSNPSLGITSSITAAGAVTGANAATLTVTSTTNAAGVATGAASSSITAGIIAAGNVATSSGASLTVTASISASSGGGTSSGASLTGTAAISTAGVVAVSTGAALAVTSTASAAGLVPSGTSLAVTGTIVAVGVVVTSTGSSSTVTAVTAASGGTSGGASTAVTATIASAGSTGFASYTGTASSAVTVTISAAGVVGRTSGATQNVTATLTTGGSANLQRTGSLLVSAVIVAAGINNSTQLGTANAATMPVPTASGASLHEPSSSTGSMGVPTASGG